MNEPATVLRSILQGSALCDRTVDVAIQWAERPADGPWLTIGVPGADDETVNRWLGKRLAWWPSGIPPGRRVGLVSSRLGRQLESRAAWFTMLRAACAKLEPDDVLIAALGTATARFVVRCAELFTRRVLSVHVADRADSLARWFQQIEKSDPVKSESSFEVFLSPPLELVDTDEVPPDITDVPMRDRAAIVLSDRVFALDVRRGGHLHRLIQARLQEPAWTTANVYIALGPNLVPRKVADDLMRRGALGWIVLDTRPAADESCALTVDHATDGAETLSSTEPGETHLAPIIPLPRAGNWPFLTHCTRRRAGPWPDQDESQYLDDLILARATADHSELAVLRRIIQQRRLTASSAAIRGGFSVVSFTAVPLPDLPKLHVFRPHRGRWDFEHYGICIRREWLHEQGARPVRYGNDELWEQLAPDERPLFQICQSKTRSGHVIDWSLEQEWRHVGDVDLSELPPDSGLVFVPSQQEAEQLIAISPWPITIAAARESLSCLKGTN